MKRKFLIDAKGMTLVELLAALALIGVISLLIISVLVSGMNSYKKVNKEISLHDEANAIMTTFSNTIFVATAVETIGPGHPDYPAGASGCTSLIKVTEYGGEEVLLGFQQIGNRPEAVINGQAIHSPMVRVACEDPPQEEPSKPGYSSITVHNHTVLIKLFIEDDTGKKFKLKEAVSFVKVE